MVAIYRPEPECGRSTSPIPAGRLQSVAVATKERARQACEDLWRPVAALAQTIQEVAKKLGSRKAAGFLRRVEEVIGNWTPQMPDSADDAVIDLADILADVCEASNIPRAG